MSNGDRGINLGQLGDVLPHRIVNGELAIFSEQKHRCGRELLGNRTGLEDRIRRKGDIVFEVRHAIGCAQHDGIVDGNADGAAGSVGVVEAGKNLLHLDRRIRR